MKLHEAIVEVLRQRGGPMTFQEIANTINQQRLYQQRDGSPIPASQVRLRAGETTSGGEYAHLFVRQDDTLRLVE